MRRLPFALIAIAASGCVLKGRYVPGAPMELAHADYEVLGKTNGKACGVYILGIDFGHLFTDERAYASALPFQWGDRDARRALPDALGKMPNAQ